MEIHEHYSKDQTDLYLSPATNKAARQNLERAIKGNGISLPKYSRKWTEEVDLLQEAVKDAEKTFDEYQNAKNDRDYLQERLAELEEGRELLSEDIDDLHARKGELESFSSRDEGGSEIDNSLNEVREQLEAKKTEMDDLAEEIFNKEQSLEQSKLKLERLSNELNSTLQSIADSELIEEIDEVYPQRTPEILSRTSKRIAEIEDAVKDLNTLRRKISRDHVNLWAVRRSVWESHDLQPEDLVLFYTGNERYEYAGEVELTFSSPELANVLWETGEPNDEFPDFILFERTRNVDIDASFIADLADHSINYVIGFTRLNDSSRDAIGTRYDSLWQFVNEIDDASQERSVSVEELLNVTEPQTGDEKRAQAPIIESDDIDVTQPELSPLSNLKEIGKELSQSKLVLLCGPSHTGKVPGVRLLFDRWFSRRQEDDAVERIIEFTFTPSMGHHDFVEGSAGNEQYPTIRPFRQFSDAAAAATWQAKRKQSKSPKFGVIIDSFHRADASDIFGPVWKVIGSSRRGPDNEIRLPESGAPFWLPESFYIVGCVDTDEKRLEDIPRTVRNKFNIIRTEPDYELLRTAYGFDSWESLKRQAETGEGIIASSICGLRALNNAIEGLEEFNQADLIGHMVFLRANPEIHRLPSSSIRSTWTNQILPRLEAQCKEVDIGLWDELLPEYKGELALTNNYQSISDETLDDFIDILQNTL